MTVVRQNFDQDLETLRQDLVRMGEIVQVSIKDAVDALAKRDKDLARRVMEGDDVIDRMQVEIEDRCISLIARQQPVATDLRILGTGLKITTDLERIGDHAVSIAEATIRMKGEVRIPAVEEEINKMGRQVRQLVESVLDLYLHKGDSDMAYDIAAKDELINQYFDEIRELTTEEIKKSPDSIITGRDYFQVISYLERIGDYAKNICEWVVYLNTGKITEL